MGGRSKKDNGCGKGVAVSELVSIPNDQNSSEEEDAYLRRCGKVIRSRLPARDGQPKRKKYIISSEDDEDNDERGNKVASYGSGRTQNVDLLKQRQSAERQGVSLTPKPLPPKISENEKIVNPLDRDEAFAAVLEATFNVIDVIGDGNCLPRALAEGLNRLSGNPNEVVDHVHVRREIVRHIDQNWDSYEPFYALATGEDKDMLIRRLGSSGEYLGEGALQVAARIFRTQVNVIREPGVTFSYNPEEETDRKIYVSFHGQNDNGHYKYLQLKTDPKPDKATTKRDKRTTRDNRKTDLAILCALCQESFHTGKEYLTHLRKVHPRSEERIEKEKKMPVFCVLCQVGFTDLVPFQKHFKSVHAGLELEEDHFVKNVDAFTCDVCGSVTSTIEYLRKHKKRVHGLSCKAWSCDMCNKVFDDIHDLVNHVKDRHFTKPVSKRKNNKATVKELERRKQGENEAEAKQDDGLDMYAYRCKWDGVGFLSKESYRYHYANCHPDDLEELVKLEADMPLHCLLCQRGFKGSYAADLRFHFNNHHRDIPFQPYYVHVAPTEKYKCDLCEREYTHSKGLIDHKERDHGIPRSRKWACLVCVESFDRKSQLSAHLKTHSKFPCAYCQKYFAMYMTLRTHIDQVHDNKNNFPCPICQLDFNNKTHLYLHVRRQHDNKMPYCPIRRKTNERYLCGICGEVNGNAVTLMLHRIIYHPEFLAPQEQKEANMIKQFDWIPVSVEAESEVEKYLESFKGKQLYCEAHLRHFFEISGFRKHLLENHFSRHRQTNDLRAEQRKLFASVRGKVDFTKFQEVWTHSQELLTWYSKKKRIYILAFVPKHVKQEDLKRYLTKPDNPCYVYVGKSADASISYHHFNGNQKLCTHYLTALSDFQCFQINEVFIEPEDGLSSQESLDKLEAVTILKLFIFAKLNQLEWGFFQKLELRPLISYLTETVLTSLIENVKSCETSLFEIKELKVNFARKVIIETCHITSKDLSEFQCPKGANCRYGRLIFSKHDLSMHRATCCGKSLLSNYDQMLTMSHIQPKTFLAHIKRIGERIDDNKVYNVVGLPKKMSKTQIIKHVKNVNAIPWYTGITSVGNYASYHDDPFNPSSTVKEMRKEGLVTYILSTTCHKSKREKEIKERFNIVVGAVQRQMEDAVSKFIMRNRFIVLYDVAAIFTKDQWEETFHYAVQGNCPVTGTELPSFISEKPKMLYEIMKENPTGDDSVSESDNSELDYSDESEGEESS